MPPDPPPPAMPPAPSASAIAARFANHWVADAFAGDESIEFCALQELLKASSEPLAGAPEATRERVALRSLQEVASLIPAAGGDADATAGVGRVDGSQSQSGEDVLSRLIREVEISGSLENDLLPSVIEDIKETIRMKKVTLPETSFQLLKGVDSWIISMTPPSQLEHNATEQCDNQQSLRSSHECVNIEEPVFPTNNAEVQSADCDAHVEGSITEPFSQQDNGVQPGAANRDGHSNGGDTSKRTHENEACNLAHRDEEPHQERKKQKINTRDNGYSKEVLTEKVPASMNKHSVLQNNSKTRVEGPEKKQQAGDKEAREEAGNDNSSHKRRASKRRCDSPLNLDDETNQEDSLKASDQEDILTASNQTGGSDEVEATSSNENGKRSSPMKRMHEKEPAGPSKSRKGMAKRDQHMPTSPRKRSFVRLQKRYSKPVAPPGRRKNCPWTVEEEDILRQGMEIFDPQDGRPIPWVWILAYGRHVFDKRRLPGDLKDKLRNMEKEKAGY